MRKRRLGNSGLVVSVVGLGCNNFGRRIGLEETRAVVRAVVNEGALGQVFARQTQCDAQGQFALSAPVSRSGM